MTTRREQGSGSLQERPKDSGKWRLRFDLGLDPVTGKRRWKSVTFNAKGVTAARKIAAKIVAEVEITEPGTGATCRVMFEAWMKFLEDRGRAVTTLHGYRGLLDRRILQAFGEVPIDKLGPHHLDKLYSEMLKDGLSPSTAKAAHRIISASFNQAVKWGWVEKNPALRATVPEQVPPKLIVPSPEETRKFIAACLEESPTLGAFVYLAAVTGCRRGEIAALRWTDVNGGVLNVTKSRYNTSAESGEKSTKSGRERFLSLDARTIQWLENWRVVCEQEATEGRTKLLSEAFIISSWPDGSKPVKLDSISSAVRRVAKRTGLQHIHLHSMRHFVATEMMGNGFSAVDTAERLGHSDPAVTMRIYTQARTGRQQEAASLIEGILSDDQ